MTKEQAIAILRYNSNVIHQTINGETDPNEVEALDMAIKALEQQPSNEDVQRVVDYLLKPVTPTHGTCKDCKHWKDSDGVYRRGVSAESKCPINIKEVYEGDFYCADFEKRGSENV
jgi:hypothetical protein